MKDIKLMTMDDCMRDLQGLINYYSTTADRMPGSASPEAKQLRMHAEALTMAFNELSQKYYKT